MFENKSFEEEDHNICYFSYFNKQILSLLIVYDMANVIGSHHGSDSIEDSTEMPNRTANTDVNRLV
jgi:hypothetical protein